MSKDIPYRPFSSFVLRTPLLPYTNYLATTSKPTITEDELKNLFKKPVIQEAIFLASPNLYTELTKWLNNDKLEEKNNERLHYALMRYYTRMSTRCTPFGLFAGVSLGSLAGKNHIELSNQQSYTRHTRLDMGYLCALSHDLAIKEDLKQNLKFYTNTSAYQLGDKIRYIEFRYIKRFKTYHLVEVERSEVIDYFLEIATDGIHLNELVKILIDNGASDNDATSFVEELVTNQLLTSELEPNVTGAEYFNRLLNQIKKLPNSSSIANTMSQVDLLLQEIDRTGLGETIVHYHKIAEKLKALGTDLELKNLFQADLKKPSLQCTLGKKTAYDILRGIRVLNKLSYKSKKTDLEEFKEAFIGRYESQEIPLLEALDLETGIGYRQDGSNHNSSFSPLVDDLILPSRNESSHVSWNKIEAFLLKKYIDAAKHKKHEVILTDKELMSFEESWDDIPNTFSTLARVFKDENNSNTEKIHISWISGGSAANWLGRFCHVDNKIHTYVKEVVKKEAELEPDVILAEIAHLPQERLGNVILRPSLRKYEIPYFSNPSVEKEFQIKLEDLMISVQNSKIVLRSKRLNKEVIPCLTCAHNYPTSSLPIYLFLCDLQEQGQKKHLGILGRKIGDEFSFLPRITYKNIVLYLALWKIERHEIEHMFKIRKNDVLLKKFKEWQSDRNIPTLVSFDQGDNKMLINCENVMCIKVLFSLIKNFKSFKLSEFIYSENKTDGIVKTDHDTFANEIILSYYRVDNNS